ncbi:MAG: B12-binding domain-containing radical SAM protein [Acidobacteria bacterium]|nr:B12-binding domain-containing radical SAM protein [Acidobacteriota bacterium]
MRVTHALLVYPEYPRTTYWSFSGTMSYIGKRAALPPLGLITVASLLPDHYDARLVDMNIEPLTDEHLAWADVIFTSTMIVQEPSLLDVIRRANRAGVPVVAGGPHPSSVGERLDGAAHLIVGEAEGVLPRFIADFDRNAAERVYRASGFPDVSAAPVPRFDLLDLSAYGSMAVQYSRGCPFQCEFCDIWQLYGRRPRVKDPAQMLGELEALYDRGWRGSVFVVDDNFIGNPRQVKRFLPELEAWQIAHGFPFALYTEASVNLAQDREILARMRDSGFNMVFLGIETPSRESLIETKKLQNVRGDLLEHVETIQRHGLEVAGGFIVGFDHDTEDIFERQARFIEAAGIPLAMVGILGPLPGTELHRRLHREGRLLGESDGNNTHAFSPTFVPRMSVELLTAGYKGLIETLYDSRLRHYFLRCRVLLTRLGWNPHFSRRATPQTIAAMLRSFLVIPWKRCGWSYLAFLLWTSVRCTGRFSEAVRLGIMGFHFEAITRGALAIEALRRELARQEELLRGRIAALRAAPAAVPASADEARRAVEHARAAAARRFKRGVRRLSADYRQAAEQVYGAFLQRIDELFACERASVAMPHGSARLAELKRLLEIEEQRLLDVFGGYRDRWRHEMSELDRGVREFSRQLRATRRNLRRQVRLLPREYRLLGRSEYRRFVRRLDEIVA